MAWLVRWTFADLFSAHSTWRWLGEPTDEGNVGGRAYLDLQNRARSEGRGTQELLTLYVVERWLARLSAPPYRGQFVRKAAFAQKG